MSCETDDGGNEKEQADSMRDEGPKHSVHRIMVGKKVWDRLQQSLVSSRRETVSVVSEQSLNKFPNRFIYIRRKMRRINKLIRLPSQKIVDFDLGQIISEFSAKEEDCL